VISGRNRPPPLDFPWAATRSGPATCSAIPGFAGQWFHVAGGIRIAVACPAHRRQSGARSIRCVSPHAGVPFHLQHIVGVNRMVKSAEPRLVARPPSSVGPW